MNSKDKSKPNGTDTPIRLQVYLARCGIASRRKCEQYIQEGRVEVNGETVSTPGTKVKPADNVLFDGKKVKPEEKNIYIALHKPPGYLCSNSDPFGRPLAVDFLKNTIKGRVFHVGRLDFESSGLIFFTNDGEFARIITHPSHNIEKEYFVETEKPFNKALLSTLKKGVDIEGIRYRIKEYRNVNKTSAYITLREGKNREIRRMFQAFDIPVKTIHRIRIGNVTLGDLPPGKFRSLTEKEVSSLLQTG